MLTHPENDRIENMKTITFVLLNIPRWFKMFRNLKFFSLRNVHYFQEQNW